MELFSVGAFALLYRQIQASFARQLPLRRLQTLLQSFKQYLSSPLVEPAKNPEDRKQIESGRVTLAYEGTIRLTADQIQSTLRLSDELNINEKYAAELVITAERQLGVGAPRGSVEITVLELYYDERRNLLLALLELLKGRGDPTLSEEVFRHVSEYTAQLIAGENLATKLIAIVRRRNSELDSPNLLPQKRDHLIWERKLAADCIFFIYYQTVIPPEEVMQMLDLHRECAYLAIRNIPDRARLPFDDMIARIDRDLFQLISELMITIISFMDRRQELIDVRGGGEISHNTFCRPSEDTPNPAFLTNITDTLTRSTEVLLTPLMISWGLFLLTSGQADMLPTIQGEPIDEYLVSTAAQNGAFRLLRAVVTHDTFLLDEDNRELFAGVVDELLVALISRMPHRIRTLKAEEDDRYRAVAAYEEMGRVGPKPEEPGRTFEELLELVAALYRGRPALAVKYLLDIAPSAAAPTPPPAEAEYRLLANFVKFAGDNMQRTLFVPYVNMLAALIGAGDDRCAQLGYHFLKNYGNKFVNWDHFFTALQQYARDFAVAEATGAPPASLSDDDVAGLEGVLRLVAAVARHHATARAVMADHPQWRPLPTLFDMLRCPVPPAIKAALFHAIGAFARTPDLARRVWGLLEASQVLSTAATAAAASGTGVGTTGGVSVNAAQADAMATTATSATPVDALRGIECELEAVEAELGEYPETLAFLRLLDTLLAVTPPAALTAASTARPAGGHAVATATVGQGFVAYVDFVISRVLLPLDHRSYGIAVQKPQLAAAALRILWRLVDGYELWDEDFADRPARSAGYVVFCELLRAGGQLLAQIVELLRRDVDVLESIRATERDGRARERVVLLSLKIIETVFAKEAAFRERLRLADSPDLAKIVPIGKLLERKREAIVAIARYVAYSHSPAVCLSAVRIVRRLAAAVGTGDKLVAIFMENENASAEILAAFVKQLENTDDDVVVATPPPPGTEEAEDDFEDIEAVTPDVDTANDMAGFTALSGETAALPRRRRHPSVREEILSLLLENLPRRAPNVTHFLLGFYSWRDSRGGSGGMPTAWGAFDGVILGSPTACMRVVVSLLDDADLTAFSTQRAHLCAQCYELVCRLCADTLTHRATLRYLRSVDFLKRQIAKLPPVPPAVAAAAADSPNAPGLDDVTAQLDQRTWLQRTAAIAVRTGAANEQRVLLEALFGNAAGLLSTGDDEPAAMEDVGGVIEQPRRKIMDLLAAIEFTLPPPPPLKSTVFRTDIAALVQSRSALRGDPGAATAPAVPYLDIPALHQRLVAEQRFIEQEYAVTAQQHTEITAEIHSLLLKALHFNQYWELEIGAKFRVFDAWRQVLEVSLLQCDDWFCVNTDDALLYDVTETLLERVVSDDVRVAIATAMAECVMLLIVKLRERFMRRLGLAEYGPGVSTGVDTAPYLPVGQLHTICRHLLSGILRHGATQPLRGTLYGAFAHFLQLVRRQVALPWQPGPHGDGPQRLLDAGTRTLLNAAAPGGLVDTMATDASDASPAWQLLALSALSTLVVAEPQLASRVAERLKPLVAELVRADSDVVAALAPEADSLNALYRYESRMALLAALANSEEAAMRLVDCGLLRTLAALGAVDARPEDPATAVSTMSTDSSRMAIDAAEWLPPPHERYYQVALPWLRLLVAMTTALPGNEAVARGVAQVAAEHCEVFFTIFKDRAAALTLAGLDELRLATALFAELAMSPHGDSVLADTLLHRAAKLHMLLLALLPKYAFTERWMPRFVLGRTGSTRHADVAALALKNTQFRREFEEAAEVAREITRNVVTYAVAMSTTGSPVLKPVLGPSMAVSTAASGAAADRTPSLGVAAAVLKDALTNFHKVSEEHAECQRRLEHVNELSQEALAAVLTSAAPANGEHEAEPMPPQQKQLIARQRLTALSTKQTRQLATLSYLIETLTMLVYEHLQFFLSKQARTMHFTEKHQEELRRDAVAQYLQLQSPLTSFAKLPPREPLAVKKRTPNIITLLKRKLSDLLQAPLSAEAEASEGMKD